MIKYILAAYDGSEQAEKAFGLALDLASKYQAKLTVVAVARFPEPSEDVETEAMVENAEEHYKELFKTLNDKAILLGINPEFKILAGHPAEQIVDFAEQQGVDHIVLGHRGNTFFHRWLLGSVAKQVMIYAHCAITIAR
jgi:nucleotide-binding universal stress UspA family protein